MSRQANIDFAGAVVDSLRFADEARQLVGQIRIADLGRTADNRVSDSGALACEVQGETDHEGQRFLRIVVVGSLALRCQRCLEDMRYPLRIDKRLLLIAPGEVWPDDELEIDEFDAIEAGRTLELLPLIEEEVLLALPIAPRHEVCEPPADVEKDREPSAFAVLAQFRKH
jgi:uncharacterized protein